MSKKAGNLLWSRQHLTLAQGTTEIDTGLTQVQRGFGNMSPNEPNLASRVQVIMLAPTAGWGGVSHGEPFVDPATGTVKVAFTASNPVTLNVLFWDPHSVAGPGDADPYGG